MGPAFFAFIGFTFLVSLSLLFKRLPTLKAKHEIDSLVSREAIFLSQNFLFLAVTFAVFWGTIFPMISELVTGTKITVGPPFFKQTAGPLFSSLVLLMAVAPFFAWRRQSWQDWRAQIKSQLAEGWTEDQIIDYFVAQYGERVLAEPERKGFSSLVWLLPTLGLVLGFLVVRKVLQDWPLR